jgi:flagellar protein FlaG
MEVKVMGMAVASVKGLSSSYQSNTVDTQADHVRVEDATSSTSGETERGAQYEAAAVDTLGKADDTDDEEGQTVNAQLKKAVDEINKNKHNSEAIFGIHEKTNRVTIKIIDKDTKKVLREFPPEKTLDMIAKVWEMAGLMVDEKR